jgi:hypothetical protein
MSSRESAVKIKNVAAAMPTTEVVMVTPQIAEKWLESNKDNRPISQARVTEYAKVMGAGLRRLNNQGVGFDRDGRLVDGQHRLWAVIESGATVPMLVVRGMEPDAHRTIDRGRGRSVAEVLRRDGAVPEPTRVAAWANVERLLLTRRTPANSVESTEDYYRRNRAGVDWLLSAMPSSGKLKLSAACGAMVFAYPTDPDGVQRFVESYFSGAGLGRGSPVLHLREMVHNLGTARGVSNRAVGLKTLRAVRAFLAGEELRTLYASELPLAYFAKAHGVDVHVPPDPRGAALRRDGDGEADNDSGDGGDE